MAAKKRARARGVDRPRDGGWDNANPPNALSLAELETYNKEGGRDGSQGNGQGAFLQTRGPDSELRNAINAGLNALITEETSK